MGKATIISGGPNSLYTIEIKNDRTRIDNKIVSIDLLLNSLTVVEYAELLTAYNTAKAAADASIQTLNNKINEFVAGSITRDELLKYQKDAYEKANERDIAESKFNDLKLTITSLQKQKQYLQDNHPDNTLVQAWCVDYNEELTGDIGTIEVPGERNGVPVLIKPAYADNAVFDQDADGQLQYSIASTPEGFFWNYAMLPGWQKWMPTYRLGVISNLDEENDTCTVTFDNVISSAQNLDINVWQTFQGVPIQYMGCNAIAFENGDRVVVKFVGQDATVPIVIGFETNPKICPTGQLIGDARSDSQGLENKFLFERQPSWTATSTTNIGGNVDWKGKIADDTLTFDGPQSRYWWRQTEAGKSISIYHNGAVLAGVPAGFVIGVSISEWLGVRYLNAVTYEDALNELRIYQRVWSETYDNDNAYSPTTNPLGWKEIYSETLTETVGLKTKPSTIFSANASGNEFQGIIGDRPMLIPETFDYQPFRTIYKFNINGESVTKTESDARSNTAETNTLVVNNDGYTSSSSEQCLETIFCPAETCADKQTNGSSSDSFSSTINVTVVDTVPGIICVDYKGDSEIFGYYLRSDQGRDYSQTINMSSSGVRHDYRDCSGPTGSDSSSDLTVSEVVSDSAKDVSSIFKFGTTEIVLDEQSYMTSVAHNVTSHTEYVDNVNTVNNRNDVRTQNTQGVVLRRDILFADIRNNHVAVTEKDETSNYIETITYTGTNELTKNWSLNTDRSFNAVSYVNGVRHVYNQSPTNISLSDTEILTPSSDVYQYNQSSSVTGTYVSVNNYQDNGDIPWRYAHIKAIKEATTINQGYGTDYGGNVLGSQTIWEEEDLTRNYTNIGVWNYLTGGDPVALTGLVGSNPRFWPVSVIK